jgi:hypothetical protein
MVGTVIAKVAGSSLGATYTMPAADGSVNDHLKTDGSGNLAWVAPPVASTPGLVLITRGTFTSAATITVDGCFTSTYQNYHMLINADWGTVTNMNWTLQFRTGGVTNTSGDYKYSAEYINATLNAGTSSSSNGTTSMTIFHNADTEVNGRVEFYNPQRSVENTYFESVLLGNDDGYAKKITAFGEFHNNVSFDGFILTSSTGTCTGQYQIFGLAES